MLTTHTAAAAALLAILDEGGDAAERVPSSIAAALRALDGAADIETRRGERPHPDECDAAERVRRMGGHVGSSLGSERKTASEINARQCHHRIMGWA